MRAREPDIEGYVDRDGVKVGYEVFGTGEPAVVFPPIDPIVHSRLWKAQVPYLARYGRVVTIDPRGNGRSDRPTAAAAYRDTEPVADTVAVMDEVGIQSAVLVGLCASGWLALRIAALHPERVLAVVTVSSWAPALTPPLPERIAHCWEDVLDTDEGWAKDNRHYWLRDWPRLRRVLLRPAAARAALDQAVGGRGRLGAGDDPETMILSDSGLLDGRRRRTRRRCSRGSDARWSPCTVSWTGASRRAGAPGSPS